MAFEKVLLSKNQGAIESEIFKLHFPKNQFQSIVDRLQTVGIIASGNDIEALINNPKAYVTDKITAGEEMKVGGLTLNKEKLFDLIEKPIGTTEIIKDIERGNNEETTREGLYWLAGKFTVLEGIVTITPKELERINTSHSLFITSENQSQAFAKLNELKDVINQLNGLEVNNGSKISGGSNLSDYVVFDSSTGMHNVKPNAVKRFK